MKRGVKWDPMNLHSYNKCQWDDGQLGMADGPTLARLKRRRKALYCTVHHGSTQQLCTSVTWLALAHMVPS